MESQGRSPIYTDDARRKLGELQQEFASEIEARFKAGQFNTGGEPIEITARDVSHFGKMVLKGERASLYQSEKFEFLKAAALTYLICGGLAVFVGVNFELVKSLWKESPIQLAIILGGIFTSVVGLLFYRQTVRREAEWRRLFLLEEAKKIPLSDKGSP